MKYSPFLIFILIFYSCGNSEKVQFEQIKTESGRWNLIWNDEFDYEGLPDSTKWSFDVDGNNWGWGNNEEQWYTQNDLRNASVKNGILTITAYKQQYNGKQYTSARLTTRNKGDWKNVRIEVRAKLPGGTGVWPAIWLLPTGNVYGEWPASGEIDIMEYVGYNPDSIFSTVHTAKYNHIKNTQRGNITACENATTGFHTYALEWNEHEIKSYIDDRVYFSYENDRTGYEAWPFDQEFHLLINLAIGGNLGGKQGIDSAAFPQRLHIDYVRIYKKIK